VGLPLAELSDFCRDHRLFFLEEVAAIFPAPASRDCGSDCGKHAGEAEAKLAKLDLEIAELRERSKHEIAAEIERIRALAQEEVKRIEQAGRMEIVVAEHTAQMELKALAARLAIERAEALLRQRMTPQSDAALFGGFVAELEGSVN
jgi:F0F1-type ATP synthase membrane subunit b/b'